MEDSELRILDALTELKNQLQTVRGIITQTDYEEETLVQQNQEKNDNYTVNITSDELNALLSLSPTEATADFSAVTSNTDELVEIKTEFLKFQEQTISEIKSLQQSVNILSEMWGRHEMEIRKAGNEKS